MGLTRTALSTVIELIGVTSLVIGVSLFSIPAALIVGGVLLVLLGASLGGARS